jgi:hypothetical protein
LVLSYFTKSHSTPLEGGGIPLKRYDHSIFGF